MNRIQLLSEQVANQIAAGEVIERPASVVKELVENALDAGATRITVEIQAGGRSLVRVTDDGAGMSRDDALLALERHATSKIRKAEDLASIASMGFRGEALPSIASVSRFTLTTRERDSDSPEGTQVVVNGGRIVEVRAAGSAPGTCVEVRQIFFNLPARRKFLRTEPTEAAHVLHYVTLAALAHPNVAFTYTKDGRTVWQLPSVAEGADAASQLAALRERLRALWGAEPRLLSVDFTRALPPRFTPGAESAPETDSDEVRVWGFIGAPGVSRATRENQHLFVNRRPVENRGLNYALMEGYHTALMKGRFPVCCLFLELSPAAVDVNVHPAKREVRFHREREVRGIVTRALQQTLLSFHAAPDSPQPRQSDLVDQTPPGTGPSSPRPPVASQPQQESLSTIARPAEPASKPPATQAPLPMGFKPDEPASEPILSPVSSAAPTAATEKTEPSPSASSPPATESPRPATSTAAGEPVPLLRVPLGLVGVVGRLYVVLESDRGMVLLDQHAAHERILYEQMMRRMEEHQQAPSQRLLLPETLELPARDADFLKRHLEALAKLGVGLSEFGERTLLLDALPPFVKASDPRRFVLELVDELQAAGASANVMRLGEDIVAKTVCRHAVKANDPLAGPELENLIEDLRKCQMPYTCPHGRPTLIEMSWRELEKKFGRSQ